VHTQQEFHATARLPLLFTRSYNLLELLTLHRFRRGRRPGWNREKRLRSTDRFRVELFEFLDSQFGFRQRADAQIVHDRNLNPTGFFVRFLEEFYELVHARPVFPLGQIGNHQVRQVGAIEHMA